MPKKKRRDKSQRPDRCICKTREEEIRTLAPSSRCYKLSDGFQTVEGERTRFKPEELDYFRGWKALVLFWLSVSHSMVFDDSRRKTTTRVETETSREMNKTVLIIIFTSNRFPFCVLPLVTVTITFWTDPTTCVFSAKTCSEKFPTLCDS